MKIDNAQNNSYLLTVSYSLLRQQTLTVTKHTILTWYVYSTYIDAVRNLYLTALISSVPIKNLRLHFAEPQYTRIRFNTDNSRVQSITSYFIGDATLLQSHD